MDDDTYTGELSSMDAYTMPGASPEIEVTNLWVNDNQEFDDTVPLTMGFECHNSGMVETGEFRVDFSLVDASGGSTGHWLSFPSLQPGASDWREWQHPPVAAGQYTFRLDIGSNVQVVNGRSGNTFLTPFTVREREHAHDGTVTFDDNEGEVITVSDRTMEKAGWRKADAQFVILDYNNTPMRGFRFFAQFEGMGGGESTESHEMTPGNLSLHNIWVKPEGTVHLMGASDSEGQEMLEGIKSYRLSGNSLAFEVRQDSEKIKIKAGSRDEASKKLAAEGHVGVTIKIVELGGSVSEETEHKHETSREIEWEALIAKPTLTITQTH